MNRQYKNVSEMLHDINKEAAIDFDKLKRSKELIKMALIYLISNREDSIEAFSLVDMTICVDGEAIAEPTEAELQALLEEYRQ